MSDDFVTLKIKPEVLDSEITATPSAIDNIYEAGYSRVIFTVRGGGCSGYIYNLEPLTWNDPDPENVDVKRFHYSNPTGNPNIAGNTLVRIFIPLAVIPLVKGTEIWYDNKLVGGGIKFKNPNAKRTCGCGDSFS